MDENAEKTKVNGNETVTQVESPIMEEKKNIGKVIREYRKKVGMTQSELADKLECTTSTISQWERGARTPKSIILRKISEILDIPPSDLLLEDDEKNLVQESNDAKPSEIELLGSKDRGKIRKSLFYIESVEYLSDLVGCMGMEYRTLISYSKDGIVKSFFIQDLDGNFICGLNSEEFKTCTDKINSYAEFVFSQIIQTKHKPESGSA